MNRFIFSIFIVLFPVRMMGQMFPLSDHYGYNALSINPAFAGCQNALSTTILYRNQWVGFKDSPKNYLLAVHMPFHSDRIGLGLLVENNSIGIFRETNIMGNYAYRIEMQNGILSLGLGFGMTVSNTAWNDLQATDPNDIRLTNMQRSAVLPDISLGVYYYTHKYYLGFSVPRFLSHTLDESSGRYKISNSFSAYNYLLTGGYELQVSSNIKIIPSFLIKYHPDNAVQVDFNAQIAMRDKIWLGIGYRSKNLMVAMIQFKLNYQLRMAYSYDFDLGSLGKYKNGSHEIGFNYIFRFSRKVNGPRQF
jgi:type IX secretion system PorP/SprF family membrane protein